MTEQSEWAEAIRGSIARSLDGVHTSIPAKVRSYNAPLQQCALEPVIVGMPPLEDVPVLWPRGGGYFVHLPLTAGDHVLVVFCEQDFGPWRLSGSAMAPALLRRHGLFAYALPGAAPDIAPLASAGNLTGAAIGSDAGVIVQVGSSAVQIGPAGVGALPVLTASEFTSLLATLTTWLGTHIHTAPPGTAGGPTTPPTVPPTPPSAVGSTVLKVSS
jgi:hypothetical protein